jgi:hypothetical protein
MSPSEPMPTFRRKALWMLAASLGLLVLAWAAMEPRWNLGSRMVGFFTGMAVGGAFSAILLWFSPDMSDAVPKTLLRRYYRDMGWAMAAYVAVMLVWKRLLGLVDATWLRVLVALLPALVVIWVMRAFVRYVSDSDEMQRRIELESGSVAALLVSAAYLAAGFLQTADLIAIPAKVAMLWVFPMLCFTYGIAKVFISRRYL